MSEDPIDPAHVEWCKRLMGSLADGGGWGVPRSLLTFVRRGNALVLTGRGAHKPFMPMPKEEWEAYQTDDFANNKRHFEAAGYEVRDELVKPEA